MRITYTEWKMIESAAKDAKAALDALQERLTGYAFDHAGERNEPEAAFLIGLANKTQELAGCKELLPYFYHPQEEWTGGDSSDPANYKHREPHIVGSFPARLAE